MFQKHLAMTYVKLNFVEHIKNITQKISNMGLLRRFQPILPRPSLQTLFKTPEVSQLDYADLMYRPRL